MIVGIDIGDTVTTTEPMFEWPVGHTWEVVADLPGSTYWINDKYVVRAYMEASEGWVKVDVTREEPPATPVVRNKYMREITPGIWVDVYDVLYAFAVTDPCLQHLIKKALATGVRGHKSTREDLIDIRDSAIRAVEHHDAMNPVDKVDVF